MHWRISSFTELQHLSEGDRNRLLRECVGPWTVARMVVRSIAVGALLGIVAAGATAQILGLRGPLFAWLAGGAVLVGSIAAYQYHLIRVRGQLLVYLERAAKQERLPMCLRCGYNLEGLRSDRCPECGTLLPGEETVRPRRS